MGVGSSSSSPSLDPRKGVGALSGSKRGEGGTLSQVPRRLCRRDCPQSLWEGCGYDGKGLMTLGRIPIHQAPSPDCYTLGLTTAGMGYWCGWHGGSWGAHITLGPRLLTLLLHSISAVFVATQPTVWGKAAVSGQSPSPCPRSFSLQDLDTLPAHRCPTHPDSGSLAW